MYSSNTMEMDNDYIKEMKREILDDLQVCIRCRMCVDMCPTYEDWYTQSTVGRLLAINLHFKYGLGSENDLSRMLFECASCRRCQERCRMLSRDARPTEIILKSRQLLVKLAQARERKEL